MLTRPVITATFAGRLMAGLAWAPPADAWGRSGYRFGCPAPQFSTGIPFGLPYYPRAAPGSAFFVGHPGGLPVLRLSPVFAGVLPQG